MHNLSIINSLIGGALIGVSAVLMLWLFGRIAGISGFVHGLIPPEKKDTVWRVVFLVGMVFGGLSYHVLSQIHFTFRSNYPVYLTVLGGVLVGIGTRMGSGCTSGHGVCGISRFSSRSIVATLTFMITAVITYALIKHVFKVV